MIKSKGRRLELKMEQFSDIQTKTGDEVYENFSDLMLHPAELETLNDGLNKLADSYHMNMAAIDNKLSTLASRERGVGFGGPTHEGHNGNWATKIDLNIGTYSVAW